MSEIAIRGRSHTLCNWGHNWGHNSIFPSLNYCYRAMSKCSSGTPIACNRTSWPEYDITAHGFLATVIETRPQLLAWRHKWQGMAYVVQELAERELSPALGREPDVLSGIREEVIDLEEDYTHNYATWYPSGK